MSVRAHGQQREGIFARQKLPAVAVGASRVLLGLTALCSPGRVADLFGLGRSPASKAVACYLGARDFVMGAGLLTSGTASSITQWALACSVVDLSDAVSTCVAVRKRWIDPRKGRRVVVLAAASAAAALAAAVVNRATDRAEGS
ncbi:MAG: hypothetical protein KatS3mg008_1196 [Acidimicrobiales bacterium]|nr:MAG: hypothetical protein KatS3mg008_1196 [Acidimicrobiales bacterium]